MPSNSKTYFAHILNVSNALVFELYFPKHMKERKVDILQFVEKDLEAIIRGREFDKLTEDQKENVINKLNGRWTDPAGEIIKRMNSFSKKSPNILKLILESR